MDKKLLSILVCPVCKGPLVHKAEAKTLICKPCRLSYPIRDEIPVMLVDEAAELTSEDIENIDKIS